MLCLIWCVSQLTTGTELPGAHFTNRSSDKACDYAGLVHSVCLPRCYKWLINIHVCFLNSHYSIMFAKLVLNCIFFTSNHRISKYLQKCDGICHLLFDLKRIYVNIDEHVVVYVFIYIL